MRPEDAEAGSPAEWLLYARSDLILARREPEPGVLLQSLCFHAQQATEKCLKAVLVDRGVSFPRTHNLTMLLELLPPECPPPPDVEQIATLSVYAVAPRYPQGLGEIGEDDYREAVRLATAVVDWAEGLVRRAAP